MTRDLNFGVRSERTISAFRATFIRLCLKQYRKDVTTYFLINPARGGAIFFQLTGRKSRPSPLARCQTLLALDTAPAFNARPLKI